MIMGGRPGCLSLILFLWALYEEEKEGEPSEAGGISMENQVGSCKEEGRDLEAREEVWKIWAVGGGWGRIRQRKGREYIRRQENNYEAEENVYGL